MLGKCYFITSTAKKSKLVFALVLFFMFALDKYDFYLLILQVIPLKLLKTILLFLLFPWKQTAAVVIGFFFFPPVAKEIIQTNFA